MIFNARRGRAFRLGALPHTREVTMIRLRYVIITAGVVGLIGSAFAADMTGPEIKALLSGKTSYLETTAAKSLVRA
jgi:hypothetical protein